MERVLPKSWRSSSNENGDADHPSVSATANSSSAAADIKFRKVRRRKFGLALLVTQSALLLLFAVFVHYGDEISISYSAVKSDSPSPSELHKQDSFKGEIKTNHIQPVHLVVSTSLAQEKENISTTPNPPVNISVGTSHDGALEAELNPYDRRRAADVPSELASDDLLPFNNKDTFDSGGEASGDGDVIVREKTEHTVDTAVETGESVARGDGDRDVSVASVVSSHSDENKGRSFLHGHHARDDRLNNVLPLFQDVHVMIFIGFGFLMTFLKRYGYSAVGVNMLLGAVVLQWATLCQGFFHNHGGKIHVDITSLLNADFASATVLISFGALLGKTSPLQLLVMAIIEIIIFAANEWVGLHVFWTSDVGASVLVHVFGAYFGLMVSLALHRKDLHQSTKEGAVYHSDVFAMIGTIFLWLFWPSFNAALAPGHAQHRVVINTYYSLAACCVTTFAFSSLVDKHSRFNMVHVQNSTLAGGVAIGTAADLMIEPWGAMMVGIAAGFLSVLGYQYITPFMAKRLRIHDTCGVHNLHGMPGVLAGIIGAILASLATEENYGKNLYEQYPMRAPLVNTTELADVQAVMGRIEPGKGWSASTQAGYQLAALFMTLAVACVGGLITGLILRLPFLDPLTTDQLFDDEDFWEIPEEEPLVTQPHAITAVKQEDSKV